MTLYASDIALFHAVNRTQFANGGGPPTKNVVEDGAVNELLGPLTEADRITGKNVVVRTHVSINTTTTDVFQRARVILEEIPSGDGLELTMASTGNSFDRLGAIKGHFEGYFTPAGRFSCWIYQTQPAGSSQLQIWHSTEQSPPAVNSTLFLVQDYGTTAATIQAVRVVEIIASERITEEDSQGRFTRQLTRLQLNTPLSADLVGVSPSRFAPLQSAYRAYVLSAAISDSTRYFGTKPITEAVGTGDSIVRVASYENQLVPASQKTTAATNLDPNAKRKLSLPAGSTVTISTANAFGDGDKIFVGRPFIANTLRLTAGATVITERNGELLYAGAVVGFSNPAEGSITGGTGCPTLIGVKSLAFTPSGGYEGPLLAVAIEVAEGNQDTTYSAVLPFVPPAGSISVLYRSNEEWIELLDRGDGVCYGPDLVYGSALFNPSGRTVEMQFGNNLPAIGSWVIVYFGQSGYFFSRGGQTLNPAYFEIVTDAVLVPGAVSIAWNDGQARSASDNGAGGLTGDVVAGKSKVLYAEKKIRICCNPLPPVNPEFTVTVTPRNQATETWGSLSLNGSGIAELTLAHTNILPSSIRLAFTSAEDLSSGDIHEGSLLANSPYLQALSDPPKPHPVKGAYHFDDDGSGHISGLASTAVNYATGSLAFDPDWMQAVKVPVYSMIRVA